SNTRGPPAHPGGHIFGKSDGFCRWERIHPHFPDSRWLQFKAGKCACLVFDKGKPSDAQCRIGDQLIRCLGPDDQKTYLGTPIGGKLRFRPPTDLIPNLEKIAASHLAPW
ncbi:Uncharacterized protein APZ42_001959, partial [Daphnia magna]